ncbi:SDR family NAD(P)-dependent oxidoreductase [Streptomyces sp. DH37]|uniref:SDR family NAD(P)-dependent oxidoreductase n=1 Tax=Streptomyces sp. DH37 TaxID=3040122 RepID=UPI002442023E|nr:SDR family NAD(P)-dependent oxidoreductase [Streptomyces sp. DH37]MDG9703223.1 SDR family NAD(P)-dependent oxidoreductase [Streptomyces sp. DH37]
MRGAEAPRPLALEGRKALVTGASRGIGRAVAIGYAEAGADVALLARGVEGLEEVAAEIGKLGRCAVVLACDVEDPAQVEDSVERAVAELGPLDVVVNNAGGITCAGPFLDLDHDQWQREMRLNFESVLHVCRSVGRRMVERGEGSVINISSVAGNAGLPNYGPYAVAKAAVISLTHSLAAEWASKGVRVNAIAPGWLHTDLTDDFVTDPRLSERFLSVVPAGRFGEPEEVVGLAVYLAGDESRFMTGSSVVIDGGISSFYGGSALLGAFG